MGLDMYINRRVHGYRKADGTVSTKFDDYKSDEFGCSNGEWAETEVAYWRKANAIHRWFVENVQGGEDDCGEYDLEIEDIKRLRDLCMEVFRNMSGMVLRVPKKDLDKFKEYFGNRKEIKQRITIDPDNLSALEHVTDFHVVSDTQACKAALPTQDGFFFGSVEYNGGYFYDLYKTIRMLDRILERDAEDRKNGINPSYTYQASW